MVLTWDCETTIKHKGNPFVSSNKMVCYSIKCDDAPAENHYYTDIEFTKALKERMSRAKLIVGFNCKFEAHWARRHGVLPPTGVRVWDCQIAEFLIRGQTGSYPSLNEALARFDLGQKDDKVAEYWANGIDTEFVPQSELQHYCDLDVELTYKLYLKQKEVMTDRLQRLCMVMGLDLLVLAEMEWNGVKLNVELCEQKAIETAAELEILTDQLYSTFGCSRAVNLDSGHQLSCLLYGGAFELTVPERVEKRVYQSGIKKGQEYDKTYYKKEVLVFDGYFTPLKGTETKLKSKVADREYTIYATGEDVLKQLRKPTKVHRRIIELLLERAEKEKLLSTYYGALPKLLEDMQWENEILHGQLNQVVARTGRLSSSNPNMQNFSSDVDLLLISRFE